MLDDMLFVLILAGMCLSILYLHGALRSRRVRKILASMDDSLSSIE